MSIQITNNKKESNSFLDNCIITTPYEKVLSIIREAIHFINMTTKTQSKLIKELSWVIKIITTQSLYTYELKDTEMINNYSQENPDFKQFVDFVKEYNEDIIQINKKNNIINSKSLKMSNQFQIPSINLKKQKLIVSNPNSNSNSIIHFSAKPKNRNNKKINSNESLSYSYTNEILQNSKKLNLKSIRNIIKFGNNDLDKPIKINNNYMSLRYKYKNSVHVKSIDLQKMKRNLNEKYSKNIYLTSNGDINYNDKYYNIKTLNNNYVLMPDILYNNKSLILKTDKRNFSNEESRISSDDTINQITNNINNNNLKNDFSYINNLLIEKNYNKNQILSKDFDIFNLKSIVGYDNVLPIIGKTILETFNLTNENIIKSKKLESFLYNLSQNYNKTVLYHNAIHAADVTQTISLFFLNSNAEKICETNVLDILSILIAALGHDLSHPGLTNNFQINASTDMALTYNDISCLENYHASKLFRILKNEEFNIFEKLNINERKNIRKRIISEILATDMAIHGKVMSVIKGKIPSEIFEGSDTKKKFELFSKNSKNKFQEQQELLDFFIHAADLAHNTKLFKMSIQWVELLSNEFWIQGDIEKKMNLPVSFLCDRDRYDIPTSQVGFIKGFIIPTFNTLINIFPSLNYTIENAKINLKKWEDLIEEHRLTGWTPTNDINDKIVPNNLNRGNKISFLHYSSRFSFKNDIINKQENDNYENKNYNNFNKKLFLHVNNQKNNFFNK